MLYPRLTDPHHPDFYFTPKIHADLQTYQANEPPSDAQKFTVNSCAEVFDRYVEFDTYRVFITDLYWRLYKDLVAEKYEYNETWDLILQAEKESELIALHVMCWWSTKTLNHENPDPEDDGEKYTSAVVMNEIQDDFGHIFYMLYKSIEHLFVS